MLQRQEADADNSQTNPPNLSCAQAAEPLQPAVTTESISHRMTLRLPSLSGSDGIPYRSVSEWLESIRMKRYILHFRSAGLDTMECVLELTAE